MDEDSPQSDISVVRQDLGESLSIRSWKKTINTETKRSHRSIYSNLILAVSCENSNKFYPFKKRFGLNSSWEVQSHQCKDNLKFFQGITLGIVNKLLP